MIRPFNPIKRLLFWIIFPIVWALIAFALVFYFDLANGPLIWFVIELIGLVAFFLVRIAVRNQFKILKLGVWACFIVITITNISFAHPSVETKSAAYYQNPKLIETPLVLNEGQVKGFYSEDEKVEVYAGIKYATAERWKEPASYTWSNVQDGTKFGPMSMQKRNSAVYNSIADLYSEGSWHPDYRMHPNQNMDEDSLYLNIWKPKTSVKNLPILVYIHGGSLNSGSSAEDNINGESMAEQGVIMITIQYRLGVFGYFAHPSLKEESLSESGHATTGNYGLLDQIYALKWIKNNALNIGGNPDNITIAGESAGSSSVSALCTSPLSAGLFKRAIGESSSLAVKHPPHTYRSLEKAYEDGEKLMEEFGCSSLEELRQIDAEKLVQSKYTPSETLMDGYALDKDPYAAYLAHENHEEALLNGYNVKEADPFVIAKYLLRKTTKRNIKERIMEYIKDEGVTDKILNLYQGQIDEDASKVLNEIFSAYMFMYPHYKWSHLALENGETVYRYQFTKENGYHGTYHSGEIIYCYGNINKSIRQFAYDEKDYDLEKTMLSYWANFAKTGDPNGGNLPTWDSMNLADTKVQELGENVGPINEKYLSLYPLFEEYQNLENWDVLEQSDFLF